MEETKPKNRAWVKDAAIVFLVVLLVLTFFSNTIMNHSLPEVATQMVTDGTITAKVRGTGSVTALGGQGQIEHEHRQGHGQGRAGGQRGGRALCPRRG